MSGGDFGLLDGKIAPLRLDPARYQLVSFDCYGTLIDWEAGILGAWQPILRGHGCDWEEREILAQYAALESAIQREPYRIYREVLREVTRRLAALVGFVPTPEELDCLPDSLPQWRPFSDTVMALQKLRYRYPLAILSNIDDDLFSGTAKQLGVEFDFVLTAQQLGSYKPAARNFAALIRRAGIAPANILHVAESRFHDITPARALGLTTVWVPRQNQATISLSPVSGSEVPPDFVMPDLASLVAGLGL